MVQSAIIRDLFRRWVKFYPPDMSPEQKCRKDREIKRISIGLNIVALIVILGISQQYIGAILQKRELERQRESLAIHSAKTDIASDESDRAFREVSMRLSDEQDLTLELKEMIFELRLENMKINEEKEKLSKDIQERICRREDLY